jgi:WD40 repeat protein
MHCCAVLTNVSHLFSIAVSLDTSTGGASVVAKFDYSGTYLAAASDTSVLVYVVKEWSHINTLGLYQKPITGIAFGPQAQWLAATSMDRTLKYYRTTED